MKFIKQIQKEIKILFNVSVTNARINLFIIPIYLIIQFLLYLHFRNSLSENSFWVLLLPMLITLVITIVYLFPKRNDKNYSIYYIFHLSNVSKTLIIIGTVFLILLYISAQCRETGSVFNINSICKLTTLN